MVAFVLTQPEVLLVIVLEQVTKEIRVKMVSTATTLTWSKCIHVVGDWLT